tara:strand:+ start:1662 stop:2018 length:357 start_codon:yes stop_codon:yes gene_type:complete
MSEVPPYSTWWLHNEDFSIFFLFHKARHNYDLVHVNEYTRKLCDPATIDGCPLTATLPDHSQSFNLDTGRQHWMSLVSEGFRMLTYDVGMIETKDGYGTVWLTLNKSESNNSKCAVKS